MRPHTTLFDPTQRYTTLHNAIQRYTTLHKAIQHYTITLQAHNDESQPAMSRDIKMILQAVKGSTHNKHVSEIMCVMLV